MRLDRVLAASLVVLVGTAIVGFSSGSSGATFTGLSTNPASSWNTVTVQPSAAQNAPVSAAAGVVNLSWTASPTAPNGHTLTYLVLRGPVGGPYSQIGTTSGLTYSDTPGADGSYGYVIQTKLAQGAGFFTSVNSAAQTGISDSTAPTTTASAPAASDVTQLTITVSYSDAGSGATSVSLYAKAVGAGAYSLVATQSFAASTSGTRTFAYTASAGVGTYSFYAIGADAAGNTGTAPGSAQSTTVLDLGLEFKRTTANDGTDFDQNPNYAPSGADTTCAWVSNVCTWASATYSTGQSIPAGTWTARLYVENDVSTIAYRDVAFKARSGVTTLNLTTPATVATGDVMIAPISVTGNVTITAPGGWNFVARGTNGTTIATSFWWRVATGGDASGGASYAWTFSAATDTVGAIQAWSGVDTTGATPVDAYAFNATSGTAHSASVTTTVPNAALGGWFAVATGGATFTQTAGWTEVYDTTSGAISRSGERKNTVIATPGSSGTVTATSSASGTGEVLLVALRPAGQNCTLTVDLLKNATVIGTTTLTTKLPIPTLFTPTISPGAVTFATGDRLKLRVTQPVSASCVSKIHYDGASAVSKITHP